MKRPYEFTSIFRSNLEPSIPTMLGELFDLLPHLQACSPMLATWLLKGDTKAEALLYNVFDAAGPTAAATAVLTESLKHETDPRIISIWNGKEGSQGASIQYVKRPGPETSMVVARLKPGAFTETWKIAADLLSKSVSLWTPDLATLDSAGYFEKKIFSDRPGVGWMLYLPKTLTAQQVPEARAIVSVLDQSKRQLGTIIVSVTDGAFSDENPEHVAVANAIEMRLVDQDLLPRYLET